MQSDIADALNTTTANVQMSSLAFSPPNEFSASVVATVPLIASLAGAWSNATSGSVRNTILGVGASYDAASGTPGSNSPGDGSSAAAAAAAANELNADALVQVSGESGDALIRPCDR